MAAIITYLIGLVVDKIGMKEIISLGSTVNFLTWISRTVVRVPLAIIGVDGFYRVTEQMLHIPLLVRSYKKAVIGGTGQALYFMEISLGLGAIFGLLLAGILIFINLPLWTTFVLASLGALAPILIARK
ncbi:hypothetical protein AMJ51_00095 [Microgenomates bacterium DG_75]|nr:MAG: hypothetical protein AMJ51_00095 [Microgenomates bacterium DG_75]